MTDSPPITSPSTRGFAAVPPADDRVAIVGIGALFPRSSDPEQFWDVVANGIATAREVPPGRWPLTADQVYDLQVAKADHVYSTRGCFLEGFQFDPEGLDLEPELADRLDPLFLVALHVARAAWRDAQTVRVDRSRVGVVLGNLVLPTEKASAHASATLGRTFRERLGLDVSIDGLPTRPDDRNLHAAGLPAGLVAQALGLGGGAYTIDAACASSLYALKLAAEELRSGRADAMLGGGISRPDPMYTQMGFSQLRALSVSGVASPFGAAADGLVVGEGAGIFVLKRLSDAIAHSDRIHGILAGEGLSNDVDGGLLAPQNEGQLRAMRAAYEQAGWSPDAVDLIECHATGTPVGDAVEFASLQTLWDGLPVPASRCVIGSAKSNVGHTLTAAGAAGLVKVLMAFRHATLPPTARFEQPNPKIDLDGSPFRILDRAEPWPRRAGDVPRRAAISGFGFGGINAHVLIEEYLPDVTPSVSVNHPGSNSPSGVAIVGLAAHFGPWSDRRAVQHRMLGGSPPDATSGPVGWWGTDDADWFVAEGWDPLARGVHRVDGMGLAMDRFRIPPREVAEMLPQQALLLSLAGDAVAEAGWDDQPQPRCGVFVGVGLDPNSTNFHVRWTVAAEADRWADELGLHLDDSERADWVEGLRDAVGPPLTANRTMGALGSVVASRVAREFRLGGPSFTVSAEEVSGLRALEIAAGMLERGEIDAAVVAAVDLRGDLRTWLADAGLRPDSPNPLGEGGAVLLLKRLADAERDGDPIRAIIRSIGVASAVSSGADPAIARALDAAHVAPESVELVERNDLQRQDDLADAYGSNPKMAFGSSASTVGHTGVASGLTALVRATLSLDQQIVAPEGQNPRFWLRDRGDGPRRAAVAAAGLDGNRVHVILEGAESVAGETTRDRLAPLGPRPAALFAIEADDTAGILAGLESLDQLANDQPDATAETVARRWWRQVRNDPNRRLGLAIVAGSVAELQGTIAEARDSIARGGEAVPQDGSTWWFRTRPLGPDAGLAFVFPGMGNHFAGMGQELGAHWPEVLRVQDAANRSLRTQMANGSFWNGEVAADLSDHRPLLFGQVALGTVVADLLRRWGVRPTAAIGFSLGETAALFAMDAWTDRDLMAERLAASSLFHTDLAGPCDAARRAWNLPDGEPVDWVAGIVPRSADEVEAAMAGVDRVAVLISNRDREVVVGGQARAVERVLGRLGVGWLPLPAVSTVHCPIVREVEAAYRSLHLMPTTPPPGIRFYSGAWGRAYDLTAESAAESILAQAVDRLDFPRMVRQAHADGIRAFVEIGPGSSCTRMIRDILADQPQLAVAACPADREPVAAAFGVLGSLIAERFPVDLRSLYGEEPPAPVVAGGRLTVIHTGGDPFVIPDPPRVPEPAEPPAIPAPRFVPSTHAPAWEVVAPMPRLEPQTLPTAVAVADPLTRQVFATEDAVAAAHGSFLRVSDGIGGTLGRQLSFQMNLIHTLVGLGAGGVAEPAADVFDIEVESDPDHRTDVVLDRDQCLEFAVGSIARVLGPEFAPIDAHPTRVRLPDEPLMLVDRITAIEGTPRSMGSGRVVTEHDVLHDGWYLDGGKIPTSIAVESGQADLFLSAYLGVDFETGGHAVYRLLDAVVTFHAPLPGPGAVIIYDIAIDGFFRQGASRLFRFRFEGSVDGQPLLTMRDGCAGFFTDEALAAGQGVVKTALDLRPMPGVRPDDWTDLVPMGVEAYDAAQVDALRHGDLVAAFGPMFADLPLADPARLPGGLMTLVDRVVHLDPTGGRFGLGLIRAEADIRPDAWFMTCHFVDDQVMPGTLMFECCLHTLRIFLTRMGWVGEADRVACEPVPGVNSRLKCRGQVTASTRVVTYEVEIKELGYGPEPYAIVDALMYADGRPIVEITDMSLRMSGLDRETVERVWAGREFAASAPAPLYDYAKILAFAVGKPSEAFGEPYRVFDDDRVIARLPGPPFQFLDRVIEVGGEPWQMKAGAHAVAEYDVPPDAWYFDADQTELMPFAVLLETALQPCGWLAAYVGSALTSEVDLSFRNLGGKAVQVAPVGRDVGTLRTTARLTRVAQSVGMIIQHYDFRMTDADGNPIYEGDTVFGFFSKAALGQQVGIRDAAPAVLGPDERRRARSFPYSTDRPFPGETWGMIDQVDAYLPDGGPAGLGFIEGSAQVDPTDWFFQAHFYQDPVQPGSLGLEAILQLLKVVAADRWGQLAGFESVAVGETHRWTYRGQVLPTDGAITVQATVTRVDDTSKLLVADGFLSVDGRTIYQVHDFTIRGEVGG